MADEPFHNPAGRRPVPTLRFCRGARGIAVALVLTAPTLGGCAVSFPMSSLLPGGDDVTGSLSKVPFGALLDEEDRRRERAALATALDPQGDGSTVPWANPKSGHRGSVTAVGSAYPADSKVCRAFVGDLQTAGAPKTVQGKACTIAAGDWNVSDLKPFKNG